jgi:hypothetical protein
MSIFLYNQRPAQKVAAAIGSTAEYKLIVGSSTGTQAAPSALSGESAGQAIISGGSGNLPKWGSEAQGTNKTIQYNSMQLGTIVPGSGYTNGIYTQALTGGSGFGALATLSVGGAITLGSSSGTITYDAGGGTPGVYPGVVIGDTGPGAVINAIATVTYGVGGTVTNVDITSGGGGYLNGDVVYPYSGPAGIQYFEFTLSSVGSSGMVTAVTLIDGGRGYVVGDSLSAIDIGPGTGFSVPVITGFGGTADQYDSVYGLIWDSNSQILSFGNPFNKVGPGLAGGTISDISGASASIVIQDSSFNNGMPFTPTNYGVVHIASVDSYNYSPISLGWYFSYGVNIASASGEPKVVQFGSSTPGTVTSGTFNSFGEPVTQSGASAFVLNAGGPGVPTNGPLWLAFITGTVNPTGTWTGLYSGAVFTPTAAPTAWTGASGAISTFGTLVGGTGYDSGGSTTFLSVFLTGGTGLNAQADITVTAGVVTLVSFAFGGSNYTVGDVLTTSNSNLGGTGSGFSIQVASVGSADGYVVVGCPVNTTDGWSTLVSSADGSWGLDITTQTSGYPGPISIMGGDGASAGAAINISGGETFSTSAEHATNGSVNISGGESNATYVNAGNINITGGANYALAGEGTGTAGSITISGGNSYSSATSAAGNVNIYGGVNNLDTSDNFQNGSINFYTTAENSYCGPTSNIFSLRPSGAWQLNSGTGALGQVLTSQGPNAQPGWAAPPGAAVYWSLYGAIGPGLPGTSGSVGWTSNGGAVGANIYTDTITNDTVQVTEAGTYLITITLTVGYAGGTGGASALLELYESGFPPSSSTGYKAYWFENNNTNEYGTVTISAVMFIGALNTIGAHITLTSNGYVYNAPVVGSFTGVKIA